MTTNRILRLSLSATIVVFFLIGAEISNAEPIESKNKGFNTLNSRKKLSRIKKNRYHQDGLKILSQELNLSKEQQESLVNKSEMTKEKIDSIRKKIKETRERLQKELSEITLNQKEIDLIISNLKDLDKEMITLKINGIIEIRKTLTEEQYKELRSLKDKKASKTLSEGLDLSPKQEATFQTFYQQYRESMLKLEKNIEILKESTKEQLSKDIFDKEKINQLTDETIENLSKKIETTVEYFINIKQILTYDQFQQFQANQKTMEETLRQKRRPGFFKSKQSF